MREKSHFCYFTGTNRPADDNPIIATMLKSMRDAGVPEDLHVFSPQPVEGSIHHPIAASYDWKGHTAKLDFARQLAAIADSEHDFVVWLDSDNYFVRDPGNLVELMRDNPLWVMMEGLMTNPVKTKEDGWYYQKHEYIVDLYRQEGLTGTQAWNSNGGLWMLRTSEIHRIADRVNEIYQKWISGPWPQANDEVILACLGAIMVDDPVLNDFEHAKHFWACDWTGQFSNHLPNGNDWQYTDWMSGAQQVINPAIVHVMRGKHLMVAAADGSTPAVQAPTTAPTGEPVGTKLSEIFTEIGIQKPACQPCQDWVMKMDQGIQWCQQNRQFILHRLAEASDTVGWIDWAKVAARGYFSCGSLLDEAIRRATMSA